MPTYGSGLYGSGVYGAGGGGLITAEYQVEWRDTLWGWPATNWALTDLQGWLDMPGLRGSNAERPGRHGTYPGTKRAGERVVELELTAAADDATLLTALRAATALDEDPREEDLVIWAGTTEPQVVRARLERRAIPTDHAWSVGHHRATLQWVASDPRRYSVAEYTQSAGLPGPSVGGLTFPASFPIIFTGSGGGSSMLTATNAGDTATWPILTITGPVTGPIITNIDSGQKLIFDPTWSLAAGETAVVDTDARSVTVNGVSRRDRLFTAQWWPLVVGANRMTFSSATGYDVAAQLGVFWRSAWS